MEPRSLGRRVSIYGVWIGICAALFAALSGAEDPSRRRDRIQSNDAGAIASRIVHHESKYAGYEVVHVAWARKGEGGTQDRWVVLLDRIPHTAMRDAVVVELRASDGKLLQIRKPVEK